MFYFNSARDFIYRVEQNDLIRINNSIILSKAYSFETEKQIKG